MLPTWDEYYLEVAKAVAQRSDVDVESAGVVIVSAGHRLIAAGFEHVGEHAEVDAVAFADTGHCSGGSAYCTRAPCDPCLTMLSDCGLRYIVWPDTRTSLASWYVLDAQPHG